MFVNIIRYVVTFITSMLTKNIFVTVWVTVVFGINCTRNAGRNSNSAQLHLYTSFVLLQVSTATHTQIPLPDDMAIMLGTDIGSW